MARSRIRKKLEGEMTRRGSRTFVTVLEVDEGNKSQPSRKEPVTD